MLLNLSFVLKEKGQGIYLQTWFHFYYFNPLFSPDQIHICGDMPCMASAEKTFVQSLAKEDC